MSRESNLLRMRYRHVRLAQEAGRMAKCRNPRCPRQFPTNHAERLKGYCSATCRELDR